MESRTSLVAQMVKNVLAKQETQVRSLGWEDPLDKGLATHSSILDYRILWTEELGELQSMGSQRVGHDGVTYTRSFSFAGSWVFFVLLEMCQSMSWDVGRDSLVFSKFLREDC